MWMLQNPKCSGVSAYELESELMLLSDWCEGRKSQQKEVSLNGSPLNTRDCPIYVTGVGFLTIPLRMQ